MLTKEIPNTRSVKYTVNNNIEVCNYEEYMKDRKQYNMTNQLLRRYKEYGKYRLLPFQNRNRKKIIKAFSTTSLSAISCNYLNFYLPQNFK